MAHDELDQDILQVLGDDFTNVLAVPCLRDHTVARHRTGGLQETLRENDREMFAECLQTFESVW